MDFQNRPGGKTGGGGQASWSESNRDRRERLRQLAIETIDLNKDPYFMKNHLGKCLFYVHFGMIVTVHK
jgi:splicing factor 3A subunit 2